MVNIIKSGVLASVSIRKTEKCTFVYTIEGFVSTPAPLCHKSHSIYEQISVVNMTGKQQSANICYYTY